MTTPKSWVEYARRSLLRHVHTWVPIDQSIYAASYSQADVEVCLEDGVTRKVSDAD